MMKGAYDTDAATLSPRAASKSETIDLAAEAELLIRGKGRTLMRAPDAVAIRASPYESELPRGA